MIYTQKLKRKYGKKLTIKLENIKSTSGNTKIIRIEGFVLPKKELSDYTLIISNLKKEIFNFLKFYKKDNDFYKKDKMIVDLEIKNFGLLSIKNSNKGTFFFIECFFLMNKKNNEINRDYVINNLYSISTDLIEEVLYKNETLQF